MAKRRPTKKQLRAAAMLDAEKHIGREKALRAALKDARGHKASKRRKKRGKKRGGKMPIAILMRRHEKLGRILASRGFKE